MSRSLPPTSPITPQRGTGAVFSQEDEVVDFYDQDNISNKSEDLLQVGKLGLQLIEELKSKNQLIEELSTRLRHIYSTSNTPELLSSFPGGSLSSNSNSFVSSIQGVSRTVSPLPQTVVNEYMDRADRELGRLNEVVIGQAREIDILHTEIARTDALLEAERDKFKEDRIKLKKEIMELQIVVRRSGSNAVTPSRSEEVAKLKAQLLMQSRETEVLRTGLAKFTNKVTEVRDSECQVRLDEPVRSGLSVMVSTEAVSVMAVPDEKLALLEQVIEDERFVYRSEISRLNHQVEAEAARRDRMVSVAVSTECNRQVSTQVATDTVVVTHKGVATDNTDEDALRAENAKIRAKYLRYRQDLVAITDRRRTAVSVAIDTVDLTLPSVDQQVECGVESHAIGTSSIGVCTSEEFVQVDDRRDEKLFLMDADLRMVMDQRDALIDEREKILAEVEGVIDQRDEAVDQVERLVAIVYERDTCIEKLRVGLSQSAKPALADAAVATIPISLVDRGVEARAAESANQGTETDTSPRECIGVQAEDESELRMIQELTNELLRLRLQKSMMQESFANTDSKSFADAQSGSERPPTVVDSSVGTSVVVMIDSSTSSAVTAQSESRSVQVESPQQLENSCIIALQKKLYVAEKLMKEKSQFFKSEIAHLRQAVAAMQSESDEPTVSRPTRSVSGDEHGIMRPTRSLADESPKHPHSALDGGVKNKLVEYYDLGEAGSSIGDISAISKPRMASLTTNASPGDGASFDYSISAMQQTLSTLSPLRIPFATPEQRDRDGDILMKTVPRTQIRRPTEAVFAVHEDLAASPLEPVLEISPSDVEVLHQENSEMRQKLGRIRAKVIGAFSLSDRIVALTNLAQHTNQ